MNAEAKNAAKAMGDRLMGVIRTPFVESVANAVAMQVVKGEPVADAVLLQLFAQELRKEIAAKGQAQ